MTPEIFVDGIRRHVLEENMRMYREIFSETERSDATDEYWKQTLELYDQLSEAQRDKLLDIMRQVLCDTLANTLSILDGSIYAVGDVKLRLFVDGNEAPLNGGLADIFLTYEEERTK
ncbi:MAG: hypothetical protein AAFQ79_09375 [Pseudomonadota bacterium]